MKFSFGKFSFLDAAIAAGVLSLCGLLWAQNSQNPIQVALLRWYQANTATTFPTCSGPSVLAFDGKHIWAACDSNSELQEYNASDGTLVATVTSVPNSGLFFSSLLYDGKSIWAARNNGSAGAVVRIDVNTVNTPSSGCSMTGGCVCLTALGAAGCASVANVGASATGLTFDGKNVWVAYGANSLSYIPANATPPITATTVTLTTACTQPLSMAFDGTNLWVPCRHSNSVQVQLVNVSTGGLTQQHVFTNITAPDGLTWDGNNMWITAGSNLYEATPPPPTGGSYVVSSSYPVPGGGGGGAAFDGKYLWVGDYSNAMATKFLLGGPVKNGAANLTLVGTYGVLTNPQSPAFDGGNIWFANSGGTTISKF